MDETMTKPVTKSIAFLAVAAFAIASLAQAQSLDSVLARMDRAAKDFKSVTASVRKMEYTAVIKESTDEAADLRIKRTKNAVVAMLEYTKPAPQTVLFKDKKVSLYSPKAKMNQVYDLRDYTSLVDQFLLLAFGTSGEDLRKNYEVKLAGTEIIDSNPATRLELIPKSRDAKKVITKIELWIPEGQGIAVQEKVTEPSGNYNLAHYSNVKLNAPLPDSAFDLKLPKDVKTVHPQH